MVVVDLGEFSEEGFDPKRWINAALDSRHPQDPIDHFLSDLEESLRSSSEKIADALEREGGDALRRVPYACREAVHLLDDAQALRSVVSSILLKLKKAEGTSSDSVAALARIDTVKQRMEATYETLQDAAGLTQLSASVEDVFASGDLPRAAETLANMRHCLSAVGEVAEFANVRKQLEVLEDRLDEMVQPRLSDAFTHRKVEVVQDLRQILVRIGRYKSLELHYTRMHLKPLKKLWEVFESRQRANKLEMEKHGERQSSIPNSTANASTISFNTWLPSFYDEFLVYLEQEWKWCMNALPEDYTSLIPKLLDETMSELCSSFVQRINLATGDVVPETKTLTKGVMDLLSGDIPNGTKILDKHLEALIELHNMTTTFARNIQQLFAESDVQILISTLKSVYSPFEVYKQRYGEMEHAILSSAISAIDIRGAVTRAVGAQGIELSETVRRMEESIPQVIVLLEAAVERCISFTGGSEVDELLSTIDKAMLQYLSILQETLKSLKSVCGVNSAGQSDNSKRDAGIERKEGARNMNVVSEEEEWSIVQGALQILTVADCLTSRASVFEASLRATVARIGTSLSLSVFGSSMDHSHLANFNGNVQTPVAGRAALDVASLRLSGAPEKARKLFNLLEQSKDPRFHALPVTSQRVAAFADTVNELVYDVLISKVRQRLNDVSRLPIWSSVEEPSAHPLPSFSSYPQAYVTSVGEYLLTLPQQLEPLAEGIPNNEASNEEAQFFATEWMFKVAEGGASLFMEQLRGIHYLTERGAQQLAADIEYLGNVLSALSMPIPPFLSTFHACVSTSRDALPALLKSDAGNHQLDLPTAQLVCKIRRISLD
ncbi:hypothetical protein KSP39_PZI014828 [Platanthera zijinensis]|uniref:Conserved oligomeric Golgi complex subunit 7 n=1 Tax=Platanthera zijinensis TaxID=2320716 RepID=A0AAP0G2C3_9ASPA